MVCHILSIKLNPTCLKGFFVSKGLKDSFYGLHFHLPFRHLVLTISIHLVSSNFNCSDISKTR